MSETIAVNITYICNHCSSTLDMIKSLTEKMDANKKTIESEIIEVMKMNKQCITLTTNKLCEKIQEGVERHGTFAKQLICLNKIINQLQDKLEKLTQDLEDIKNTSEKSAILDKQMSDVNNSSDNYENGVLSKIHLQSNSFQSILSDDIAWERERYRRFQRRNRVVFIGVPKDMNDKDFINELSRELKLDIVRCSKTGRFFSINSIDQNLSTTLCSVSFKNVIEVNTYREKKCPPPPPHRGG